MIGALPVIIQSVNAEQFGHQYYWGWRDGYYMQAFSVQTHDSYSWPNDDEGHPPNYWKGADAGIKYAQEHVMVKVVQGREMKTIIAAMISIAFLMGAQVIQMEKQQSAFAKIKIIQNETRNAILINDI